MPRLPWSNLAVIACFACDASLATAAPTSAAADPEAAYVASIHKRADAIINALSIDGPQAKRVHKTLVDRYWELRSWHDANDEYLRRLGWKAEAEMMPSGTASEINAVQADRNVRHSEFLKRLAVDLNPVQIDIVKDELTYNKLQVTLKAYGEIVPDLTEADRHRLFDILREAREEAMDGGSSEEKSAIFKRYKNRCKAYLTSVGHDVNQAYRDWGEAQKRKTATTSRPAGD